MSKRKEKTNIRLSILDEINQIDRISEEKDNVERQWNGSQDALQNLSVIVNNERYKII